MPFFLFRDRYPYFEVEDDRWKNSVRHNLSMNPHFRKGDKSKHGAGHLWVLADYDEEAEAAGAADAAAGGGTECYTKSFFFSQLFVLLQITSSLVASFSLIYCFIAIIAIIFFPDIYD